MLRTVDSFHERLRKICERHDGGLTYYGALGWHTSNGFEQPNESGVWAIVVSGRGGVAREVMRIALAQSGEDVLHVMVRGRCIGVRVIGEGRTGWDVGLPQMGVTARQLLAEAFEQSPHDVGASACQQVGHANVHGN